MRGTVSFQDERTGKQYALKEVRRYSAVQRSAGLASLLTRPTCFCLQPASAHMLVALQQAANCNTPSSAEVPCPG